MIDQAQVNNIAYLPQSIPNYQFGEIVINPVLAELAMNGSAKLKQHSTYIQQSYQALLDYVRYALFDNDVAELDITEQDNRALLNYRSALFKRRVTVFDISNIFLSPTRLINAYQLEWNQTAYPAVAEKKQQQAPAKPDLTYVSQVISETRQRKCAFKFFLSKVAQRLLLDQHHVEEIVSLFGPQQSYCGDQFLFVKSYQKPMDVDAFVEYCKEQLKLEFAPKEDNSPPEEAHKTKPQKQKADSEQQKGAQKQLQSAKKEVLAPLSEILAQPQYTLTEIEDLPHHRIVDGAMKATLGKYSYIEDQREQFLVRQKEIDEEEERQAQQRLLEAQSASQASATEPQTSQNVKNGRKQHAHPTKAKTPVKQQAIPKPTTPSKSRSKTFKQPETQPEVNTELYRKIDETQQYYAQYGLQEVLETALTNLVMARDAGLVEDPLQFLGNDISSRAEGAEDQL